LKAKTNSYDGRRRKRRRPMMIGRIMGMEEC